MKKSALFSILALGLMLSGIGAAQTATAPTKKVPAATTKKTPATAAKTAPVKPRPALTTDKAKASYALGENLGLSLKRQEVDIDPDLVSRGLKDALAGRKPALTDEEAKAALTQLQAKVRENMEAKIKAMSAANKQAGDAFLAANKSKEGVVTLPSGLQYKILKEGTGPKPTATETVECNYRGTLLDGKEFDNSYKRGEPATFPVGGVIKGWTEALQLMPVGSKWQLFVPSNLAYGERSPGAEIPPNSTLIFEVELLSIKQPDAKQPDAKQPEAKQPDAKQPDTKQPEVKQPDVKQPDAKKPTP
jgi:FKBP-type peptidyl-prolyl cis-trans isomerase